MDAFFVSYFITIPAHSFFRVNITRQILSCKLRIAFNFFSLLIVYYYQLYLIGRLRIAGVLASPKLRACALMPFNSKPHAPLWFSLMSEPPIWVKPLEVRHRLCKFSKEAQQVYLFGYLRDQSNDFINESKYLDSYKSKQKRE